ncbi:outer membrane channel protein [Yersinia nurmii]|uniref:Outer membrane channel protein n=1 Tax=Yersinia nurmii TaxID=685706 RepID=A0ABM9S7M9_9GAMM|nr:TolC family outer membrane protein [Yersinia nurmii]CNE40007.1 outer membrane channel protein [Yersinia nurmii]
MPLTLRIIFLTLLVLPGRGNALGLLDAWELAVRHDPQYQAAGYERDAGQEEEALGLSGLLPTVQYSYGANNNYSTVSQTDNRSSSKVKRDYDSYVSMLSLRQPLIDYGAYARYRQGIARKLFADQRFRDKSQELIVRLYRAYSSALLAQEKKSLLEAQLRAYQEQIQLNRRLLVAGEGTQTDIDETAARLTLTQVQLIEQQDALDSQLTELENMIGRSVNLAELRPLTLETLPQNISDGRTLAQWRDLAMRHNARLAGQRNNLDAKHYEIESSRSGHLPTLQLVASSRNSRSESEYNYNQKYDTQSVGLQLNVPIYAGGSVSSATRQATAQYQQSQAELDQETRQVLAELKRQFNLSNSGAAKIRAWQMTVDSAQKVLIATRRSVLGGERINLDVLLAEQQLFNSKRDLAEAKYGWLQSWLELRYNAGTLQENDILQLAAWFEPEKR